MGLRQAPRVVGDRVLLADALGNALYALSARRSRWPADGCSSSDREESMASPVPR